MSVTSARVGRGLLIMVWSICVATITGFFFAMHFCMIVRCMPGISSMGTSMPRSPRATMMPYDASMISSMLSTPSRFSIFDIILMSLLCSSSMSCTAFTSAALRTKEWAMKSMSCSMAKSMFFLSFSVSAGRSMCSPGMFTLLCDPSSPSFCTSVVTTSPSIDVTFMSRAPSSKSMSSPTFTSLAMFSYDTLMLSCDVSTPGCP